ncbi:MAG: hypothetical protein JSV03_04695 [Planctomycetota bacterium]|nr:MAG: hypothetical protein JSV03_04695 [Planctomycetota bacterium]
MSPGKRPPFPLPLLRFWCMRILPVWCLIAIMIFLIQIAVCGIVHDNEKVKMFLSFLELLPSVFKTALGGEELQATNVSGLIAIGYQHPLVLILYMLFAVGVPTRLLAGEVQNGTMELILSLSATKTQVYVCAGILTIVGMFALVLVMLLGTYVGTSLYRFDEEIPLYPFFRIAIIGGLLASAVGAISLLAAALFRRRSTAVGVTVAYLVVNYFACLVAELWPGMEFLGPTTLFWYIDGPKILHQSTWPLSDISVLTSILVTAAVAGGLIWQRRDLPL